MKDEDISFHSFDLTKYIKNSICYFNKMPLISQPVNWEYTQTWHGNCFFKYFIL